MWAELSQAQSSATDFVFMDGGYIFPPTPPFPSLCVMCEILQQDTQETKQEIKHNRFSPNKVLSDNKAAWYLHNMAGKIHLLTNFASFNFHTW